MVKSNNSKPYPKSDGYLYMRCLICKFERKRMIYHHNNDIYNVPKIWWTKCICPLNEKNNVIIKKRNKPEINKKSPRINYEVVERLKLELS